MSSELMFLAWTLVLALVQILLTAQMRTLEVGTRYMPGPRDVPSPVPVGIVTGRLARAQKNLFETLPIFIGAVLATQIAGIHNSFTYWGALLYFAARVIYVPLYAFGISYLRTLVWLVGLTGIILLLVSLM